MLSLTNIMSTLTAVATVILGLMTQFAGCHGTSPEGIAAVCDGASSWLPPTWAVLLGVGFGGLTFVLKLFRPGGALASLFGPTAVVVPATSPNSVAGTATPEHVAQP